MNIGQQQHVAMQFMATSNIAAGHEYPYPYPYPYPWNRYYVYDPIMMPQPTYDLNAAVYHRMSF